MYLKVQILNNVLMYVINGNIINIFIPTNTILIPMDYQNKIIKKHAIFAIVIHSLKINFL